ncbi:hypothetical protein Tco_0336236 [Tanacetum coccineum]
MIDYLSIVETDKVNHAVETDMVKLMAEIESFGMSADELDKETGSSDGLKSKQVDLSYVHALNEPHFHEIHVVPSKHEADQSDNSQPFDDFGGFMDCQHGKAPLLVGKIVEEGGKVCPWGGLGCRVKERKKSRDLVWGLKRAGKRVIKESDRDGFGVIGKVGPS